MSQIRKDPDPFVPVGEEKEKDLCDQHNPLPTPAYLKRDGEPCGECCLKLGERCDICGVRRCT